MEEVAQRITRWLRQKVQEAGAKGLVVGMSGGIDSSVVAVLSKRAMGDAVLGLIMPCHSNPQDIEHALMVAEQFGIPTEKVDLTPVYDTLVQLLPPGTQIAAANLKPRLRMLTLYYFSNSRNYLVAGTGNKTEIKVGYFTKYGDGGVDLLPIGDLYKTEVRELARFLGIPEVIIAKPPSAGLWEGQTDEGEMGITYPELDRILRELEEGTADESASLVQKVKGMMAASEHKRAMPPVCVLS